MAEARLPKLALHAARHPRLVQCTVTSYGTAGPEADRPAYDVVLQAESGLMSLTGFEEGEPVRVGVAMVDILSALYGLVGRARRPAPAGRHRPRRPRRGLDGRTPAPPSSPTPRSRGSPTAGSPPASARAHPNLAPYQAFRAADGWFVVGVGSQELWRRFCAAIERPGLADDPRFATSEARVENRADLDRLLGDRLRRPSRRPLGRRDASPPRPRRPARHASARRSRRRGNAGR